MFHYNTKFAMVLTIFIFMFCLRCSTSAKSNKNNCERSCGEHSLQYPFGFSSDCEVKLNCSKENKVKIGDLEVQSVTSDGIFVSLPVQCNRNVSFLDPLFRHNFAPSWSNTFLVQSCESNLSGCVIPTSSFAGGRNKVEGCDRESEDLHCFTQMRKSKSNGSREDDDVLMRLDWERVGCKFLFSALAFDRSKVKELSLQFQMVELGWWLEGNCSCSNNASCTEVNHGGGKLGFRCRCDEGFVGDGFKDGDGCRRG